MIHQVYMGQRRWGAGVGLLALAAAGWWFLSAGPARVAGEHAVASANPPARDSVPAVRTHAPAGRDAVEPTPVSEPAADAADPRAPVRGCAAEATDDCAFLDPDPETLAEMARCGVVRYDGFAGLADADKPFAFDAAWIDKGQVTEPELAALRSAAQRVSEALRAEAIALAVQAGLEREWAEASETYVVLGTVQSQDIEATVATHASVAAERIGQVDAPASVVDRPAAERATRTIVGVGERFEDAVAEELGADRAAELRQLSDGWPGVRTGTDSLCRAAPPLAGRAKPAVTTLSQAEECIAQWQEFRCRFSEPDPLVRQEMTRCGIVRFDFPTFLMARDAEPAFDAEWVQTVGLTQAAADTIAEVAVGFRESLYEDVTKLALEVGQTQAWADATPLLGLMGALHERNESRDKIKETFKAIARERGTTGRVAPAPPGATVDERFIRRIVALGSTFEAAVAARLGATRAQQLRDHADGWPSVRMQTPSQCNDAGR